MAFGDFYFAINATFRFIHDRWGEQALIDYWTSMADAYHAPLARRFRQGGLPAVKRYWEDYFAGEPDADVTVELTAFGVEIVVRRCPAIRWLERSRREIVPYYCEHCRYICSAIAERADLTFELRGGRGSCYQVFRFEQE